MKKKRGWEVELLEKVVSPEQWYASPGSGRWLLTTQPDNSLLFETQGPFGLISCRIQDPKKFAAEMVSAAVRHYKEIADNLEWSLEDFRPNIEAYAEAALHLFVFGLGDILLDTVGEAVEEAQIKSAMIGDGLMVAAYNRLGIPVGLTETPVQTTQKFIDKVSKRRRARLAQAAGTLPDLSKGSNLERQARHMIESATEGERLTWEVLAARLTERYEYNPPLDGPNLKRLLNRHGVKLREKKRDK